MIWLVMMVYFVSMLGIGYWASKQIKSADDYMVGGRKLSVFVTAIAHQAAALSGWLFIAWPAQVANMGLGAIWTVISSGGAPITNFMILGRKMSRLSKRLNARSVIDLLESRYYDEDRKIIRTVSVIIIFICMSVYMGSQVMAAGKAFQVVLNWDYTKAVILGAVIVIAYTSAGGLLAVAYTDMVQGILMILAVLLGLGVSLFHNGGYSNIISSIGNIDKNLLSPWISPITLIGLLSAGYLGYLGQPQIIQMFMGMKEDENSKKGPVFAGAVGITLLLGSFVALLGAKVLFADAADPDTNFLRLFLDYTPNVVSGIVLAAVMAAVMSSADALLHVANTAVVHDFYNKLIKGGKASDREIIVISRISAVIIGLLAVYVALNPFESVLWVNWWAWGGLSTFGPLVVLGLYWKRATREGAVAGLILGFLASVIWFQTGLYTKLHLTFVSFFVALITMVIVSLLTKEPPKAIQEIVDSLAD